MLRCTGCGNTWTHEELMTERAQNPALISCCPERKMIECTCPLPYKAQWPLHEQSCPSLNAPENGHG